MWSGAFFVGTYRDMGNHKGYIAAGRRDVYDALRRHGHSKKSAAKIANAGTTHVKRSRMAKKAARTRKLRGRK